MRNFRGVEGLDTITFFVTTAEGDSVHVFERLNTKKPLHALRPVTRLLVRHPSALASSDACASIVVENPKAIEAVASLDGASRAKLEDLMHSSFSIETVGPKETCVLALDSSPDVAAISRFLLRSETITSSRIEGIAPAAHRVALDEVAQQEGLEAPRGQAGVVARNVAVVRESVETLAAAPSVSLDGLPELHRELLPDSPSPTASERCRTGSEVRPTTHWTPTPCRLPRN